MTTTDPRAAAIEAAARALRQTPADWPGSEREVEWSLYLADAAVAAAVPHLTAGLREYLDHTPYSPIKDRLYDLLDALERGGEQ